MARLLSILLIGAVLCGCLGCAHDIPPSCSTSAVETSTTEFTEETVPVIALSEPYAQYPRLWTVNCDEYISFSSSPGESSSVNLPAGTALELLGWQEKHAKVRHNGNEGYVLSSYIQPADADAVSDLLTVVRPTAVYSYTQMKADIEALVQAYPHSCSTQTIGHSEESRTIPVLKIGSADAKYHILIQGAMHGREHMTAWLVMAMADFWLANHITQRTPDVCYHLIPMINPDGVTVSQSGTLGAKQQPIYFRDVQENSITDSLEDYAYRWKANALGVDLNRNFPANWDNIADIRVPSSQGYPGETPFSAAESTALRDYTLRYPFRSTLSYHAFGSIIYYEYGTKQSVNDQSYDLARTVQNITGYRPHTTDPTTISTTVEGGGYKDWVMEALEIPSLTIEIGCKPTPLTENELPSIFFRNLPVLPTVAQWVTQ